MTETLEPGLDPTPLPSLDPEPQPATELAPVSPLTEQITPAAKADLANWQVALALALIVLVGGYFRLVGIDWDSGQHLHPDERFMTSVASSIHSVNPLQYFDTANSTLNPFPYGSYTYGMFPLYVVRYVAEIIQQADYDHIGYVGRVASAIFDLAATVLLFFLGARFYNRRVGLLASALYGAAVLPIQLSHYFTVDSFATVFIVAAFLTAAPIMERGQRWQYFLFGLLVGLAMACKVNTAPIAGIVVLAGAIRLTRGWHEGETRTDLLKEVLIGWLIAGGLAALAFRVFQPYAFDGPSLFGIGLNQRWLDIMNEVTNQVAGNADFPPNNHWADRSQLTYAWVQNAVWGLGLPLGLAATLAWAWAAMRTWRGASLEKAAPRTWQAHLLVIVWVGAYFAWQNAQFWRYMRYFMPIYPLAVLLAAWALIEIYDWVKAREAHTVREQRQNTIYKALVVGLIGVIALTTYGYAFAFTRIYTRMHTRVTASWWMLENIPGPLNAHLATENGVTTQPMAVPGDLTLQPGQPWVTGYRPVANGTLDSFSSYRLYAPETTLHVRLTRDEAGTNVIYDAQNDIIPALPQGAAQPVTVFLRQFTLNKGETVYLQYTVQAGGNWTASNLSLANATTTIQPINGQISVPAFNQVSGVLPITPEADIKFDRLQIGSVQTIYPADTSHVTFKLSTDDAGNNVLATSETTVDLKSVANTVAFPFPAIAVEKDKTYFVTLTVTDGAPLRPSGTLLAMETSWDDALPLRIGPYDPFGGIYRQRNLELFETDTAFKRDNMIDVLTQADYLVISSNRSYDAMPRLPLRYPLTLKYYQALFGCDEQFIYKCAYPAQPGVKGPLGYELVAVFESNPNFGPLEIMDQEAEEAFTVYDHPKVLIFKRTQEFSAANMAQILDTVDLTQVLEQLPRNYTAMPTGLKLTPDRLQAQTEAGTWSDMFDPYGALNYYQPLGVAAWYGLLLLLGWVAWPIVFVVFRGLPDRGYPLAKLVGLLTLTWAGWFASSYKLVTFTRPVLWLILILMSFAAAFVAYRNWAALTAVMREQRRHIFIVEAITLALFLYFLWVRWLNPDLWHPWLGGEKPADLSFFQSAIRAVYFPAYDPWLAGNYVNYYYYGYVVGAVPTKMLGILPSIAYNLVLPMLFSFAGIGAFCGAYNLVAWHSANQKAKLETPETIPTDASPAGEATTSVKPSRIVRWQPYAAGLAAAIMMVLLGNLFQVHHLYAYLSDAADPPQGYTDDVVQQLPNAIKGAFRVITGQAGLPGDKGRWYFGASRAILFEKEDTPITEFPYFSFLYADLHPHLSSMGMMLAAMGWMMSLVFAADRDRREGNAPAWRWYAPETLASWFVPPLIIGALQPTQTWDYPGFLFLGVVAIVGAVWLRRQTINKSVLAEIAIGAGLFAALTIILYYPFRQWFATDFSSIEIWKGRRSPLLDYLGVHGLFLFILITFLIWQSRPGWKLVRERVPMDTLLNTQLGDLLPRIRWYLAAALGVLVLVLLGSFQLWTNDYQSVLFALPLVLWLAVFFFAPGQPLAHRVWSALMASGLGLTIIVEIVVLKGDLGRSNTVFKFYIEVWAFFSVAAGAALAWLWPVVMRQWSARPRRWWLGGLVALVAGAASYTVIATYAKTTDRWPGIDNPPHTLDGMAYMLGSAPDAGGQHAEGAAYNDEGSSYPLVDDYNAIQWLLQNVKGTPAIVEGNSPLYRWGTRMAINTGLASVVGWDHHLKQHDSILPPIAIEGRLDEVKQFYDTTDRDKALEFLKKYRVRFIIVGALERKYYQPDGLAKFDEMVTNGLLIRRFPEAGQWGQGTNIYEVVSTP